MNRVAEFLLMLQRAGDPRQSALNLHCSVHTSLRSDVHYLSTVSVVAVYISDCASRKQLSLP